MLQEQPSTPMAQYALVATESGQPYRYGGVLLNNAATAHRSPTEGQLALKGRQPLSCTQPQAAVPFFGWDSRPPSPPSRSPSEPRSREPQSARSPVLSITRPAGPRPNSAPRPGRVSPGGPGGTVPFQAAGQNEEELEYNISQILDQSVPGLEEALAQVGLEPSDLLASSGLSAARRQDLLSLALSQLGGGSCGSGTASNGSINAPRGATLLYSQMRRRLDTSAERSQVKQERQYGAVRRHAEYLDARRAQHEARFQEQQRRAERIQRREARNAQERQECCDSKDQRWRERVVRGIDQDAERRRAQAAALAAQDERANRSIDMRNQQVDRWKRSLDERNCYVRTAGEWSRQDSEYKSSVVAQQLSARLERSEGHINACRSFQDLQQDAQRAKAREREHEVRRVARMKEHDRLRKESALQEDSIMFQRCMQMRGLHSQLARMIA